MHITNQKLSFDIFTVGNLQNTWSLLNILMIFGIKEKSINFDPYNVLLAIAYTCSTYDWVVVQGDIWCFKIILLTSDDYKRL